MQTWSLAAASQTPVRRRPPAVALLTRVSRPWLGAADRSGTTNDEKYVFDMNGNRAMSGSKVWVNGANNRLLYGPEYAYTYDDEGNRISREHLVSGEYTEYEYDYRQRLTAVRTYTNDTKTTKTAESLYAYDAFDRRTVKSVDATGSGNFTVSRYVYDGQNIVLQLDNAGAVTHRYPHGPAVDQVLADERVGQSPAILWALTDNLGTVRDVVDSTGAVQNHIKYDSFGKIPVGGESNPAIDFLFGYTGFERDEETGLSRSETRYYDPAVGRWTSEDPIGIRGGDANLARFVHNSPPDLVDPSGLSTAKGLLKAYYDEYGKEDTAKLLTLMAVKKVKIAGDCPWFDDWYLRDNTIVIGTTAWFNSERSDSNAAAQLNEALAIHYGIGHTNFFHKAGVVVRGAAKALGGYLTMQAGLLLNTTALGAVIGMPMAMFGIVQPLFCKFVFVLKAGYGLALGR